MKRIKLIIILFMATIMTVSSIEFTHGFNKSQIPVYIEIGLFFEGTAKSTIHLKSNNGFEVGRFPNNEFIKLLDILDEKDIILRKDAYYIGREGNFVEHTGSIATANSLNLQGPYHIQIGGVFNNRDGALDLLESLVSIDDKPYLVYEKGWKVFVGLYPDQEYTEEKAYKIEEISGEDVKVISPSSTRIQVLDLTGKPLFMFDTEEGIYFQGCQDKGDVPVVNVEGKNYRGAITAKRLSNSDMSIVNKLLLEEYLYGVVPKEMPASWSLEALKAQAVAARGTAVSGINRFRNLGFDLCNTTRSQVYAGYDIEHPNSNQAVDETRNKLLTYNGEIANAFYHSNSGGHTENSENIWSAPVPYIRGVKDDFSLNTTNSIWMEALTKEQIKSLLEKNNIFIGDVLDIQVDSMSENGRVLELVVYGTRGKEVLVKEKARTVFGLKSTWFTVNGGAGDTIRGSIMAKNREDSITSVKLSNKSVISAKGITKLADTSNIKIYNGKTYRDEKQSPSDTFIFNGKGWGHGLGMSQYGAKKMAEEGYNYIQILTHYYTGTEVE